MKFLYLINLYCDLSHDYCVIEVDDNIREFCYFGDELYLHKRAYTGQTFLNSNVSFMFYKYLHKCTKQKYILYKKIV